VQQSTQPVIAVRFHFSRALLLVSFLLAVDVLPAWSEEAARLENLTIALWPEYDQSAVLVTYRAQLAADVVLPAQIALPIPTYVGMPHAVAKRGVDGNLYVAASTLEVEGDWSKVIVMTDSPVIQLEYYAPILATAAVRNFSFHWPGGLEIASLQFEVLQPRYATNFVVMPSPTNEYMTNLGVMVHQAGLGALSSAQDATITLSYSNPSERLTVTPTAVLSKPALPSTTEHEPSTLPPTEPKSRINATQVALIVLGVAAAFIGGLWMGRNKGSDTPA